LVFPQDLLKALCFLDNLIWRMSKTSVRDGAVEGDDGQGDRIGRIPVIWAIFTP
jgi:hypothetical protein